MHVQRDSPDRLPLMKARVPKFLKSLYELLHAEDRSIIRWNADGRSFQVLDIMRLEQEVLPKYFKHSRFSSFQRQLNNFGFRKWTKTESIVCTFSHYHLVQRHPDELINLIELHQLFHEDDEKSSDSNELMQHSGVLPASQFKRPLRHYGRKTRSVKSPRLSIPAAKHAPMECEPENSPPMEEGKRLSSPTYVLPPYPSVKSVRAPVKEEMDAPLWRGAGIMNVDPIRFHPLKSNQSRLASYGDYLDSDVCGLDKAKFTREELDDLLQTMSRDEVPEPDGMQEANAYLPRPRIAGRNTHGNSDWNVASSA